MDRWGQGRARQRDSRRSFDYRMPTEIVYGIGRSAELPKLVRLLGGERPLLVTDPGVRAAGLVDAIEAIARRAGIPLKVFDAVESDPPVTTVETVRDLILASGHDLVIGLGGGSSLDVAKAAAAMATNPGDPLRYVGRELIVHDPLPVIAIPTTAGTGSEVTMWSVLTDVEHGAKVSIGSMRMMPRVALLDPELTLGLPRYITAATGMDALSHAMESWGSIWNHPIAEALSLEAIGLVGRHLRRAVERGDDLDARQGMLLASTISELAANSTRLGLAHALAIPLGARHHVPHGVANAILLGPVASFNAAADPDRYRRAARTLDGSDDAGTAVDRLRNDVGIDGTLAEWSVTAEDHVPLAAMAMRSDNVQANPREAAEADLIAILAAVS